MRVSNSKHREKGIRFFVQVLLIETHEHQTLVPSSIGAVTFGII